VPERNTRWGCRRRLIPANPLPYDACSRTGRFLAPSMAVTPPENCARTRRWGHEEKRRSRWGRRRNRKAWNARPVRAAAGSDYDAAKGLAASSPVRKPRQLFRVESVNIIEDEVATPKFAVGVDVHPRHRQPAWLLVSMATPAMKRRWWRRGWRRRLP
jgi:hypothetical protein